MKSVVISVFDSKTSMFGRPFFVRTEGEAIRSFIDEVNRAAEDNNFFKHPEDYILYHISEYDDATGQFENVIPPKMLMAASAAVMPTGENKISKV